MSVRFFVCAFAFASIGITCAPSAAQGTPEKGITKKDAGSHAQKNDGRDAPKGNPDPSVVFHLEGSTNIKNPANQPAEDREIQRSVAKFTGYLVAVGFLQALILAATVWVIFRQMETARTSERAWIVAKVERANIPAANPGIRVITFSVRVTNTGRTPAFLSGTGNHGVSLPRDTRLADTPPPYNNANIRGWAGKGVPLQPGSFLVQLNFDTIGDTALLRRGTELLWIYGYVNYRDVFGKSRTTRYCFHWDNMSDNPLLNHGEDFMVAGPSFYNHVT
jgi:hypothetical protein